MPPSGAIHREQQAVRAYPANVTFADLIRANKRKSAILMVMMTLLAVALGAALGVALVAWGDGELSLLLPSALLGAGAFAVVAVLASLWSFYGGAGAVLAIAGARELSRSDDPQLQNVVEELAIAAGIPCPKIYVMDSPALNAFATGRDPEHGVVAITTGLRQRLDRDELAGVIAHEISHIRHYDIRFAMLMATMVGLIVFVCDAFWRVMWHGRMGRRSGRGSSGKGGGAIMVILLVVAVLFAAIAPTLAMVIRLAVSRQREYLADAGAVELTRYPQGLIGALRKLGACHDQLAGANRATAHLYIVNPLKSAMRGKGHERSSVFRTHPPLHERIERLEALIT